MDARITELLYGGAWNVHRGLAPDGKRVVITVVDPAPPDDLLARLALPFDGIPRLRGVDATRDGVAIVEDEPRGWTIGELRWPLPIDEVIRVGLDLARVLRRLHDVGAVHGALRPQTTWIDETSRLTGTTPRPELAGLHCAGESPFRGDPFRPAATGAAGDVAQLGMMLHRMATHESPTANDAPWTSDDPRSRAVEELARGARTGAASLGDVLAGLERLSR